MAANPVKTTTGAVPVTIVKKKPSGKFGQPLTGILLNAFKVNVQKNFPFYKYDLRIHVKFPNAKSPREITKQLREDFSEVKRKGLCAKVVEALVQQEPAIFRGKYIVHDRSANMYSLDELDIPDKVNGQLFKKNGGMIEDLSGAEYIEIRITPVKGKNGFQGSTNDLDNIFKEFANVCVTSAAYGDAQSFIIHKSDMLVMEPEQKGFQKNDLGGGALALPRIQKSVKVVEGNSGVNANQEVILVMDVSKAPVHTCLPLEAKIMAVARCGRRPNDRIDIITEIRNNPLVLKAVKGLELKVIYRPDGRPVVLKSFAGLPRQEIIPDLEMTVQQYYEKKLKIVLKRPDYPCVRDLRGNCYPIEVLSVCDFQRVKKNQELPSQSEQMIKASAVLPHLRKQQTMMAHSALGLQNPQSMQKTGMTIGSQMIGVPYARLLASPKIQYARGMENVQFGKWRLNRNNFLTLPTKLGKWQCWGNVYNYNEELVKQFLTIYIEKAAARGIRMSQPELIFVDPNDLEYYMKEAKEKGVTFIFMISETDDHSHKFLKYLEVRMGIPTQEVTVRVAKNAVEKHQVVTFDNIILKTNIKNRGLNHTIAYPGQQALQSLVVNPDRLIIGLEMSHPASGGLHEDSVSVIGWAANALNHPAQYTGNFVYVPPRETEPTLVPVFKQVFGRLRHYRDAPKWIDVYIRGVSEGQLDRMSSKLVENLREVLNILKIEPDITVIACSGEHCERFYHDRIDPNAKAGQQSAPVGMVVDKGCVNKDRSEYFLLSHAPVQGTASVPKYSLMVDTSGKRSMDEVQAQTFGLCHLHQYSLMTTSKPTPLYCASDYAQRGADILPFIMKNDLPGGEMSFDALNQVTYQKSSLQDGRMA